MNNDNNNNNNNNNNKKHIKETNIISISVYKQKESA